MSIRHCVAVDLGASSGRVMLANYDTATRALTLREVHRFINRLQKVDGYDCWDIDSPEAEIRCGLVKVCEQGILIDSIGIDTGALISSCWISAASASACQFPTAIAALTA